MRVEIDGITGMHYCSLDDHFNRDLDCAEADGQYVCTHLLSIS